MQLRGNTKLALIPLLPTLCVCKKDEWSLATGHLTGSAALKEQKTIQVGNG